MLRSCVVALAMLLLALPALASAQTTATSSSASGGAPAASDAASSGADAPKSGDVLEVRGGEAPATGGGSPRTGIEWLKLALLGLVFVLVGARIRAVLRRRGAATDLAPDGLPHAAPAVGSIENEAAHPDDTELEYAGVETTRGGRDEWSFPDPDEAAPTGLLPSTAMARRNARRRGED